MMVAVTRWRIREAALVALSIAAEPLCEHARRGKRGVDSRMLFGGVHHACVDCVVRNPCDTPLTHRLKWGDVLAPSAY